MSPPRLCALCSQPLATKFFWDNLTLHKDCLDAVLAKVVVGPAGEVKIKEQQK